MHGRVATQDTDGHHPTSRPRCGEADALEDNLAICSDDSNIIVRTDGFSSMTTMPLHRDY